MDTSAKLVGELVDTNIDRGAGFKAFMDQGLQALFILVLRTGRLRGAVAGQTRIFRERADRGRHPAIISAFHQRQCRAGWLKWLPVPICWTFPNKFRPFPGSLPP